MPLTSFHVDAIFFDMDGTLVDSAAGVAGAWQTFRETYPGINVDEILSSAHGVRTVDNLKKYCGIQDPAELEREAERFEEAIVTSSSTNGNKGIVLLPGVASVIEELAPVRHLPNPRWTICTSATRAYATSALGITGIPIPDVFVVAEDVVHGKPHPDPYLLGAEKAGVKPENCVVFEDAPNGILSGRAAGCKTVGLLTSHSRQQVEGAKPTYIVKDMSSVTVRVTEKGVEITLNTE